jgi:hypothetical protein
MERLQSQNLTTDSALAGRTFYSRRLQLIQAIYEDAKRTGRVGQEEQVGTCLLH